MDYKLKLSNLELPKLNLKSEIVEKVCIIRTLKTQF